MTSNDDIVMRTKQTGNDVPVSVAHHDDSRADVSYTAIVVAAFRALEARKGVGALVQDRFAEKLAGDVVQRLQDTMLPETLANWVDFMAVRTRFIDDLLIAAAPKQLVIVGAGLDTRAYRLDALRSTRIFEVDFSEVLAAKSRLLREFSPIAGQLMNVTVDLAVQPLGPPLCAAGLDQSVASVWLLEGLTGYLEEAELQDLLAQLSRLACPNSTLIATFLGRKFESNATHMHRYYLEKPADADVLLSGAGWIEAAPPADLFSIGRQYGRSLGDANQHYFLVQASRAEFANL